MVSALVLSLLLTISIASPAPAMPAPYEADGCGQHLILERSAAAEPLPVGAAVPCPGIRPGAEVWSEVGGCTLNFVFRGTSIDEEGNPVDEGLFIGTAGHCILGGGEQEWAPGQGPAATDADDRRFGEWAYAVLTEPSETSPMNFDFSLIRIDDEREAEVKPGICHFGGPTGMTDSWSQGDVVHHFGQGIGYGPTVPGRSGVIALNEGGASSIIFAGSALFGDSGSAVIDADGRALAVLVAILPPTVAATPIAMQVERAEAQLDMQLDLVEASLA